MMFFSHFLKQHSIFSRVQFQGRQRRIGGQKSCRSQREPTIQNLASWWKNAEINDMALQS